MTFDEVMGELERLGTEQNRKIFKRHGAAEPLFGVSFANLYALQKRIQVDQALAEQLWATRNADARTLATLIADPARFTSDQLEAWMRDLGYYGLVDALVRVVGRSPFAREKMERWIASDDEWLGRAGWHLVGHLASTDASLPDAAFEKHLATIEARIHRAKNRTRDAMNSALINIGARNEALRKKAVAAAKRIGVVEVDHGETGCKTPDAAAYIDKMWARKKGDRAGARPAAKKTAPAKQAAPAKKAAPAKGKAAAPAKPVAKKAAAGKKTASKGKGKATARARARA